MLWNFEKPKAFALDWPLIDSPVPVILILLSYAFFVLKLGKLFMRNRQPYNVKNVMLVYNAVQVIYNLIIFLFCIKYVVLSSAYDFRCLEALPPGHPIKFIEQSVMYAYYINKIVDLVDTIIFVLRKSFKQISLLHVYHHTGMVALVYLFMRMYGTGGHPITLGILNTFVHCVMYSYYFLSALKPQVRKALWWKHYITIMQMTQFIIIFLHTLYVLIFSKNCGFPRNWLWASLIQSIIMMGMFIQFYVNAYIKPKQKQPVEKIPESQVKQD